MKNLKFIFLVAIAFLTINKKADAQISIPAPSPASTVTQVVGLTEVTVSYSRPSMKGRKIFGELKLRFRPKFVFARLLFAND